MERRGKDSAKLRRIVDLLASEQPLPPRYSNHPLHGNWKGKWECHVEPDWLLVYRIDDVKQEIVFTRTGTHSDIF